MIAVSPLSEDFGSKRVHRKLETQLSFLKAIAVESQLEIKYN